MSSAIYDGMRIYIYSLIVATYNIGTNPCKLKRGCEFADRIVFSSKVRFPGLSKETAPDFVRVAKITTPRVVAFKPSCRVSTGGSGDDWKGRLPAGWSEESPGMVTEVMGNLGGDEIYEQG